MNENDEGVESGEARMRVRARLIALIGDELISDAAVAVVELVKNAFDADASSVTLRFQGTDPADPSTLIIQDDGHGMDLDTVLHGWFEPGTVKKKRNDRSPGGRLYQGAKGIGRFAAARLADSLLLETCAEGHVDGVTVLFSWGAFDDDSYLDEITMEYQVGPIQGLLRGTRLTLSSLHTRRHWQEDDFRSLHNRLSRLISPFQHGGGQSELSGFDIQLEVPGFPDLSGPVEAHLLTRKPKYRLTGALDANWKLIGAIEVDGKLHKTVDAHALGKPSEAALCGPFDVEIRAWDRDRTGLSPFMLQFDQSISGIRRILDEYCGVAIYRDGFRVHPYGERGNDWLSLDTRSRQAPTRCLANNQIIAAIRISRERNPELVDRTTREGLVHNDAYDSLRDWFVRTIAVLEEERYRIRPRDESNPETVTALYEPFDMSDVVKQTNDQLGRRHPIAKLVRNKDSEIREGVKRLQDHYSRVLLAAGLGQLVDVVIHEIGAPLGRVSREIESLENQLARHIGAEAFDKLVGKGAAERLGGTFTKVRAWLEQIASLRQRLVPKAAGRRGRKTSFDVREEVEDNIVLFESLLQKQNISVETVFPKEPLVVHMSRSDLGQIVANLLDNSIYWITRHFGDGKGGKVCVVVDVMGNGFRLQLSDNGPGVSDEDLDRIFDAEYSRKPNGMGLGLFIARQVIEPYGRLVYSNECQLGGACFEAKFERGVGL